MIINKKTRYFLALFVTCVFLFQNCATIVRGTSQEIPITSNPTGAKIIVDGKVAGDAPLSLVLKKRKSHVIRIEKQDYNPAVIEIKKMRSTTSPGLSIFGNIFWGVVGVYAGGSVYYVIGALGGLLVGYVASLVIDSRSGAYYNLSPNELNIVLTKIEGTPQTNLILIDAEKFQDVKWIRIKCVDSEEENEVVNLEHSD